MLGLIFKNILKCIRSLFKKNNDIYNTIFVEDLPDLIEKKTIYVLGEGNYLWSAAMICPCGCGELIQLSLHEEGRPRWRLVTNDDKTVSLTPSIWRNNGCRSHFFLKHGRIEWCKNDRT